MIYAIVVIYSIALLLIFVFSLGQLHLTFLYLKSKKKIGKKQHLSDDPPIVTVQLPLYNEEYVTKRLLQAVIEIDYPKNRLEIQVLDDSTDGTSSLVKEIVSEYAAQGFSISHIQRTIRTGYKAGALQEGLIRAKGDFIVVFDADFLPGVDFLQKTVPCFSEPSIGMVQTRWGHVNNDYSLLTKLQAFGLDAHFTVEQSGRSFAGSFINFNGTAGIWRKSCILDAGGWSADTLTEDLDLSYRAQINGWKFQYLEDVVSPAELPVIMPAIKSQQYRWNKGAAETAVKNLGNVLRMKLNLTTKVHAVMHLLNSSVFIPLLIASILSIPMLFIKHNHPELSTLFYIGTFFIMGFFSIGFYYWISTKELKPHPLSYFLVYFPLFIGVTMGLALHNAIAVLQGLFGHKTAFIRTPKFNILDKVGQWKKNKYLTSTFNLQIVAEGLLALYFLFGILYGISIADYGLIFFHVFLAFGYLMVFIYSIVPIKYASK
jgi:cellulose synthase/poly-beta-1,6-N-acetylglucosamine synthase-like glycosyltransferase